MLERHNYKELGDPVGPYSHAVKHHNTLYVSGLTAFGRVPAMSDIKSQVKAIFEQLNIIAKTEGAGIKDIIKVTLYVSSMKCVESLREALASNYEGCFPASSLVEVASLFSRDIDIELEAIIALPETI